MDSAKAPNQPGVTTGPAGSFWESLFSGASQVVGLASEWKTAEIERDYRAQEWDDDAERRQIEIENASLRGRLDSAGLSGRSLDQPWLGILVGSGVLLVVSLILRR